MYWTKLFRAICPKTTINYFQQPKIIVRHAGSFQRPNLKIRVDQLLEIKNEYFCNRTELSSDDWQKITELLVNKYKHINKHNVDAVIVGVCTESSQLLLAKSYIKHLKSIGRQPNDATLGKLLKIYNVEYHSRGGTENCLTKEEQQEILDIYETLMSKHDVLENTLCESLIQGLVTTEKWRSCLDLLEMMKMYSNAPTLSAYTTIVMKAFAANDMELGWRLLHQMVEQDKQPKCEIFLILLDTILKNNMKNFCTEIEKLLIFLGTNNITLTKKVVTALENIATEHPNLLTVKTTSLTSLGKCCSCGNYMENIFVSDEDFKKLQKSFMDKVLIRNDVFLKSTPLEVEQFCKYIEQKGPFDCVVDGLNVAYSMGTKKPAQTIAGLVRTLNFINCTK